jgi:hypothetical protein
MHRRKVSDIFVMGLWLDVHFLIKKISCPSFKMLTSSSFTGLKIHKVTMLIKIESFVKIFEIVDPFYWSIQPGAWRQGGVGGGRLPPRTKF